MNDHQDLFDQFDQYFSGDGTDPTPEPINIIFDWLDSPRLHRPHSDAVDIFIKQAIAAMSESTDSISATCSRYRLNDILADYYNLRADIDEQMDRYYRAWWDISTDDTATGEPEK